MSGLRMYQAGFTDLVSVVPPEATIAETSSLTDSALGKIPGKLKRDGTWVGYNWLKADAPTEEEVERWEKWGANVGLKGTRWPALDIDVDNLKLAKAILKLAYDHFGLAPTRLSKEPRRLLVMSTTEPFGRVAATLRYQDEEHLVEFLGDGRQYLVAGKHPSGAEYRWVQDLEPWGPADPPAVNRTLAYDFLEGLKERLQGKVEVVIHGSTSTVKDAPPQEELKAPSLEALQEAVEATRNKYPDRDSYIRYGTAIKAAAQDFEEDGYACYLGWAQRWEGGENPEDTVRADWERMHPPFRIGWEFIRNIAGGDAVAEDGFDVLPEASPDDFPSFSGAGEEAGAGEEGADGGASAWAHTDTWVAEQLAGRLSPSIRYVPEAAHWHVWNGTAWAMDRLNRAEYLIRQALVELAREQARVAHTEDTKERRKKILAFANQLQSRGALTRVVPELQAHPALTLTVEDFDKDPWLLNTPGGVVDLRTGGISGSDPALLLSKSTAVEPVGGDTPLWYSFLERTTKGDTELQRFLQMQAGYALTGVTTEQSLCFIHGPGRAGKSVFINTLAWVMGNYHETADANTFALTRSDRHPTDLAGLVGARLVTAIETQEGRAWDTQRVKALTGGDEMKARFMRQDFFAFRSTFKIMMVGNFAPEIKGADDAMLRRLFIVPFTNPISKEEADPTLPDKLKHEAPGILAWALEGTRLWLEEGMQVPEVVREATRKYKEEEDPVGTFISERCRLGLDEEVSRVDLFSAWKDWCYQVGEEPGTLKQLKRRFDSQGDRYGFQDARITDGESRIRGYKGLGLIPPDLEGI